MRVYSNNVTHYKTLASRVKTGRYRNPPNFDLTYKR